MTTRAVASRPPIPRRSFLGRVAAAAAGLLMGRSTPSEAKVLVTQQYMGEIRLFAGDFVPQGWARCDGQILQIAMHTALFGIIGQTYGGDGSTTFALPDLRGRVAIHHGEGPGLSVRDIGESDGLEGHTLELAEMPAHTHVARASSAVGVAASPAGQVPARTAAQIPQYGASADTAMATSAISTVGGGESHENRQPFLVVTFIIALQGMAPPR